jgi:hypothetical protein
MSDDATKVTREIPVIRPVDNPPLLPDDKRHWLAVSLKPGCGAMGLEPTSHWREMLQAACLRLLAEQPGRTWSLPEDRKKAGRAGRSRRRRSSGGIGGREEHAEHGFISIPAWLHISAT